MKMQKKKFLIISLLFIAMCSFYQCQTENLPDYTQLIGNWKQTSRTVNDAAAALDSTRIVMTISESNICIIHDSTALALKNNKVIVRSGWSYADSYLNLAIDLPASWKVESNDNELWLERVDFAGTGIIQKTKIHFVRKVNTK